MNDHPVIKLLGETLLTHSNEKVQTLSLCGKEKFLGLYYSAYWCPSCIAFTPELVKFYKHFKASDKKDSFEIVYISSDPDEKHFKEHRATMPWLALPFPDRIRQMDLARYYRVQSIPALIIIESDTAKLVTSSGRACVMDDPVGSWFPWRLREITEILGEISLIASDGVKVTYESISSKVKGLYFSAHWKMFAVVEFGDNSVSAVPTCWLNGEFCSWPNVKDSSRLAKASVEPKEDWKTYKVFIKSIYITFDEAKKNEKKFETTSNLENTDDDNFGKGKRCQKQLPFQSNSSDDDDDIIKGSQSLIKFPPVPISKGREPEPSAPAEPCSFTISPEIVNSIPVNYEVIAEGSRVSSDNSATNTGSGIPEETLKVVLQNRFTLKEHGETLSAIMSGLNFLFEKLQTGSKVQSEEVSLPVCLPLTNLEDLKVLEDSLKDENLQEYLCPPCKAFTPALVKLYKKMKKKGHDFEFIFISSDRSEESFKQHFANMPWPAVPYSEEKCRKELAHLYGVGGIPCLIMLDKNNSLITKEGRMEVNEDPDGEEFPWRPKLVDELGEKHISKLNEEPCLILFTTCEDKELELAHFALSPVAEEYEARLKRASIEENPIPQLNFFYAGDAEICDSVRDIIGFGDDFPFLVILDIPNGKKYIHEKKKR